MDNVWVVAPLSLLFCSCSRGFCGLAMCLKTFLAPLLLVLNLSVGVTAQVIAARCLPGWEWNQNSLGQDACVVATILDANCRGDPNYTYPILDPGEYYIQPRRAHFGDMTCDCDTVMYSLSMGCSTCQKGIAYSWPLWIQQCPTVLISDYSGDIPPGTAIPRWAFYNVTLLDKQTFDPGNAQNIGRDPEAKPKPSVSPQPSVAPHGMSRKTAIIISGVVGGVCSLIIITIVIYFCFRWRLWKEEKKLTGRWEYPDEYDGQWKSPPHSPTSDAQGSSFTGPTIVTNHPYRQYVPPPGPSNSAAPDVTSTVSINGGRG